MHYARLVKAVLESEWRQEDSMVSQRETMVPPRAAFLCGFNDLAMQSIPLPKRYDAFAAEVVGNPLLSTDITPDASLSASGCGKCAESRAGHATLTPSGRKWSLWEDVMSDRPASQQEQEPKEDRECIGKNSMGIEKERMYSKVYIEFEDTIPYKVEHVRYI